MAKQYSMFELSDSAMKQSMHTLTSQDTDEWLTPPRFIFMAKQVMGGIDLDPASCDLAQTWIKADRYYTQADNALGVSWHGRVWLNPPYNHGGAARWVRKLEQEHLANHVDQAILLCFAKLGYHWFNHLLATYPCCLMYDRIAFVNGATATAEGKAKHGSAFVYFGNDAGRERFYDVFESIGKLT